MKDQQALSIISVILWGITMADLSIPYKIFNPFRFRVILFSIISVFSLPSTYANDIANDIVISGVDVVDVINEQILSHQEIVINNGQITAIHPQPAQATLAKQTIDGSQMVAIPGFINTHTHLWQHLAKGFYPNGNLQEWVRIYRFAHYLQQSELLEVTRAAATEALLSGITTVADFTSVNFSDFATQTTCDALNQANMGGLITFWNPAAFIPAHVKAQSLLELQKNCQSIDIWMAHGPLSFYPISSIYDAVLLAKELGVSMTEHTMENVQEQRDFYASLDKYLKDYGHRLKVGLKSQLEQLHRLGPPSQVDGMVWMQRLARQMLEYDQGQNKLTSKEQQQLQQIIAPQNISPVPLLNAMGAFDRPYISIHSVWQTQSDMDIYRQKGVSVSHNPESNMYLSSGVSPILAYQKNAINISLATDGAASNDGINFFSAMRAMWNLQKIATLDTKISKRLNHWQVLQSATINGAKAMGLENNIGSLNVGKEADIVLVSKQRLKMSPYVKRSNNPIPLTIYSGTPLAIDTVISNGKITIKDQQTYTGPSVAQMARNLSKISDDVVQRYSSGKNWQEKFYLDPLTIKNNWYRYASVRKKDRLNIEIINTGSQAMPLYLAMSGSPFGGTAAAMLSQQTQSQFPLDPKHEFWEYGLQLAPQQKVRIKKAANGYDYLIELPDGKVIPRKGKPEQLLLLVDKNSKNIAM